MLNRPPSQRNEGKRPEGQSRFTSLPLPLPIFLPVKEPSIYLPAFTLHCANCFKARIKTA